MDSEFIIVQDNGSVRTVNGRQLSDMYDLSDCGRMDDIAGVYAVNESCELVKVRLGELTRDPDWTFESSSIVFGYSPVFAGSKRVGTVHWTDH